MLHGNIVEASLVKEARDFGLPEAEALMPEGKVACLNINDKYAVNVDVDAFVPHNQFSMHNLSLLRVVPLTVFPQMDVHISNVKLVFPTDQEKPLFAAILIILNIVEWLLFTNFEEVEAKFIISLVGN